MEVIKAPTEIDFSLKQSTLFLAGSIEMGTAENWQERVAIILKDTKWILLNPRRDDWDSSWDQTIKNPEFRKQVEWELNAISRAEKVLFYFSPDTKSPISLLELGLIVKNGNAIVVCPDGFWRKGNIEVVCDKFNIPLLSDLEEAVKKYYL
jgi:hypothetical protein